VGYCGERVAVNHDGETDTAVTIWCKAWTCEHCAPRRKKQLMCKASNGNPKKFLTLTHRRRDGMTPDEAARHLSKAWRLLRLRIQRKWKIKSLPFICVMEKTKLGWPHLHILFRGPYLPQKWLSAQMQELCQSPVVNIQALDSKKKAVAYVVKYCAKAAEKFSTAKRYWQSKDWDQSDPDENPTKKFQGGYWEQLDVRLYQWAHNKLCQGWTISDISAYKCIATKYPAEAEAWGPG